MKLHWYWDEWYQVFAEKAVGANGTVCIEVSDAWGAKYLAAKKEFEKLSKELRTKCGQ